MATAKSKKRKPGKTIFYDKKMKIVKTIMNKEKVKSVETSYHDAFRIFQQIIAPEFTWTFDQYLLIQQYMADFIIKSASAEQKQSYIAHLHYITTGKRVIDEIEIPRFEDFIKGIVINSKKEQLPSQLIIGSHGISLPENIADIYKQFMADTWSNNPDAPIMPLHDFCMKYTPDWYKETINRIVNSLCEQKQSAPTDTYGIVNVLRAWNLLDDYRLGNAIRLIAKTDHSELRLDLLEAKELIGDVLDEIEYKTNPGA